MTGSHRLSAGRQKVLDASDDRIGVKRTQQVGMARAGNVLDMTIPRAFRWSDLSLFHRIGRMKGAGRHDGDAEVCPKLGRARQH